MKILSLLLGISYNLPKMLSSEFQSHSTEIIINPLTLLAQGGGDDIFNLLIQMSYNMPKILSSKFQPWSIKIEDFKINPINPFNPISTKEGNEN